MDCERCHRPIEDLDTAKVCGDMVLCPSCAESFRRWKAHATIETK